MALLGDVNITCQAVDGRFPRLFKALTKTQLLILPSQACKHALPGSGRLGPGMPRCQSAARSNGNCRRQIRGWINPSSRRLCQSPAGQRITSQLPLDAWHDVIGEPTFADAILDRLVHNAYRVKLDGQSMRKTKLKTGDESTQY